MKAKKQGRHLVTKTKNTTKEYVDKYNADDYNKDDKEGGENNNNENDHKDIGDED